MINCTASLHGRVIIKYPEYIISQNSACIIFISASAESTFLWILSFCNTVLSERVYSCTCMYMHLYRYRMMYSMRYVQVSWVMPLERQTLHVTSQLSSGIRQVLHSSPISKSVSSHSQQHVLRNAVRDNQQLSISSGRLCSSAWSSQWWGWDRNHFLLHSMGDLL